MYLESKNPQRKASAVKECYVQYTVDGLIYT